MNPIALSRHWQLTVASLVVLLAIVLRPGDPVTPGFKAAEVSVPEAVALIDSGAIVIDVRAPAASASSHLPGALLIPLEVLAAHLSQLEAAKAQSIVVYCGNGTTRGPEAAQILTRAGFAHVVNLQPGIEGWRASGLPVASS